MSQIPILVLNQSTLSTIFAIVRSPGGPKFILSGDPLYMRWKAGQVSILSIVMKLFSIVILCWWNFKKPLVHSVTTVNWVKRPFFHSWKCIIIELFCPIESWYLFKETISQKKIKKNLKFFFQVHIS